MNVYPVKRKPLLTQAGIAQFLSRPATQTPRLGSLFDQRYEVLQRPDHQSIPTSSSPRVRCYSPFHPSILTSIHSADTLSIRTSLLPHTHRHCFAFHYSLSCDLTVGSEVSLLLKTPFCSTCSFPAGHGKRLCAVPFSRSSLESGDCISLFTLNREDLLSSKNHIPDNILIMLCLVSLLLFCCQQKQEKRRKEGIVR